MEGSLREGVEVTVVGTVAVADGELESPIGKRRCVFYAARNPVDGGEYRREAYDFYVQGEVGGEASRVRVRSGRLHVAAAERLQYDEVALLDADISHVSARLREIKATIKQGPDESALRAELKPLRKLATLLCAVRARARGNVHVGGTLEGQDRYIEQRSPAIRSEPHVQKILVARREVTLSAGDAVSVTGIAQREHVPDPDAIGGGYRAAPTREQWTVVAPPDGYVTVSTGDSPEPSAARGAPARVAANAPTDRASKKRSNPNEARNEPTPARRGLLASDYSIPIGLAAVLALVVLALLLAR